jgi:hypothetical protein
MVSDHHLGLTKSMATVMLGAAWPRSSVLYSRVQACRLVA